MAARALSDVDHAVVAGATPRARPTTGVRGSPSTALLTALQRSAGNAAVSRELTRRAPDAALGGILALQRCGPTPCNCSDEERAAHAAQHPEEEAHSGPTGDLVPGSSPS